MTEAREGVCPSCMEPAVLKHEWHPEIPRPDGVVDDLICGDCHASLRRVAGEDEHLLVGMPAPPPMSSTAVHELIRMTRRGLQP